MIRNLHLIESNRSASTVWPSIASASAQLRRPRRLEAVPTRPETPAATGPVARPRLTTPGPRGR
jgi:hypothetical protein